MLCRRLDPKKGAFVLKTGTDILAAVRIRYDKNGRLQTQMQAPQHVRIEKVDDDEFEVQVQLLKAKEARDGK